MSLLKNKLTPDDLQAMVLHKEFFRPEGSTLTVCVIELNNGCTLTGTSNVIDPANYDQDLGEQAAYSNTVNQLWEREGYALKRDMISLVERAARASHMANKLYCESLGDTSQLNWDAAPDWQKNSARMGVRAIMENPDMTPEESHLSWLSQKWADGWVYGPVKDPETKEHPCMVSYSELPEDQRRKGEIFGTIVRSVLAPV